MQAARAWVPCVMGGPDYLTPAVRGWVLGYDGRMRVVYHQGFGQPSISVFNLSVMEARVAQGKVVEVDPQGLLCLT